ncbi:ankyrin repeat-containing domain protein [Plasmopara halstedii]|uniref:Ankyrin repeat-containing domain protein n=1 Tax=Plasmopara halstedii TaxID=4781 RepID=A0A0P1ALB0_PLAHL|nr:ankyrin repeat-containing domain protein [Plasmopara halstedii]CEG41934.1 ankyrin repeat-containing domain protein [Plasmopara halstedii]|eukprot:XP_024578303.1 ankyrin repeat-containing domain protein [Plasmopara halstedii]
MMSSERLVLSLALGTILAVCGLYCNKLFNRRRPKSLAAARLDAAPRVRLSQLQQSGCWVALCGTAFDVTGDPFFDFKCDGIYSHWIGHDVTMLILQLGLVPDAADDAKAVNSYLDCELPLDAFQGEEEVKKRRYKLVQEWFVRLYSRFEVIAQLSDRFVGEKWESLRAELLSPEFRRSTGGKCPLGFGSKTESKVVTYNLETIRNRRYIKFQGRCYDVTDSNLFHPKDGQFAHFVGHDITYALAIQSARQEDLDVIPNRAYTFEEQVLLERYRKAFARELFLLEVENEEMESVARTETVNVHQIIEKSDSMTQKECVHRLKRALDKASNAQVNAVCSRTTMTPLHKAVEKNRLDLVEELLRAGADVEARAALYDDETPMQMARRFHFDDIAAHLQSVRVGIT